MESFEIKLKAKNSCEDLTMFIDKHFVEDYQDEQFHTEDFYSFVICGKYLGKVIQIDFNEFNDAEFDDLIAAMQLLKESKYQGGE